MESMMPFRIFILHAGGGVTGTIQTELGGGVVGR
jgi:hypothetical protein